MKKSIAMKWVKALRSGEYRQCREAMCLPEDNGSYSYCCLGVLDVLYTGELNARDNEDGNSLLPSDTQKWAGLQSNDGSRKGKRSLVKLNDASKYSFARIADIIEKEWESL